MNIVGFVLAFKPAEDEKISLGKLVKDYGYSKPTETDKMTRSEIGDTANVSVARKAKGAKRIMATVTPKNVKDGFAPEEVTFCVGQILHDFSGAGLV